MRVFILAVALTLPTTAYAVDGFQDAKWGMSPEEVRAAFPEALCKKTVVKKKEGDRLSCRASMLNDPRATLDFYFVESALRRVDVDARVGGSAGLQAVLDGLVTKYGQPTAIPSADGSYVESIWPAERLTFNYFFMEPTAIVMLQYEDAGFLREQEAEAHRIAEEAARRAAGGL